MTCGGPDRGSKSLRWLRQEARTLGFEWRFLLIVTCFTAVLMIPLYHRGEWFEAGLRWLGGDGFFDACRHYGISFKVALRVAAPVILILAMREKLRDYGLGLGKVRLGLMLCGLFYLLYIPCFIVLMLNDSFRGYYAGVADRYAGWSEFLGNEVLRVFVIMTAGEFLYRGFLLFGTRKYFGPLAALLLPLIPYVYGHQGKSEIEALGSFPVGLALAYLAIKTDSIWYGVLLHATIAIGFNALIFALQ